MSESVLEMNPWFEENRRQAQTIYELRADNARLRKAMEPFAALARKRDDHYRRRGGNPDAFPDTHPSYDIDAEKRELPMGVWRRALAALAGTKSEHSDNSEG